MHPSALLRTIGFYIVLHPWLSTTGVVKVGYSTNVEQRLETASYKTCFTPEWSFFSVFECETELDSLLLEQSVLYCLSSKRVARRELLHTSPEEVHNQAVEVSKALQINTVIHRDFNPNLKQVNVKNQDYSDPEIEKTQRPHLTDAFKMLDGDELTLEVANRHKRSTSEMCHDVLPNAIAQYIPILDTVKRRQSFHSNTLTCTETEEKAVWSSDVSYEELSLDFSNVIDEQSYKLTSLREYQTEAVQRIKKELLKCGRAICQMACRCGKTPVAYQLLVEFLQLKSTHNRICIYLVPGLGLLRQTTQKLYSYGLGAQDVKFLVIGSHPDPIICDSTILRMTTDPTEINAVVKESGPLVILSTYHSSGLLKDIHSKCSFIVFDECHRVCGSTDITPFNVLLLLPQTCPRLFLTATPTYDTPIKMSNEKLFGGVAYRYYLREGINAGFVNDFAVRVILGETMDNLIPFIVEAMKLVNKLLVFCRSVEQAEKLFDEIIQVDNSDVEPFERYLAYSRQGSSNVASTLLHFCSSSRAVLFNIRLFQEGVEIPDLNGVFFAAPRYSSRDIIQSVCRPLNILPGKPISYVFIPAAIDTKKTEMDPINLEKFSTLVPFTDALMDEDPSLFEYMIDPRSKLYNFSVVGVRNLALTTERIEQFILPAIRRGVRFSAQNSDRLSRANRLPWKYIFTELRRIVLDCNRYPKTNDAWIVGEASLSMNRFYQFCRIGYHLYLNGKSTYLKTHQLCDLESLPLWRSYGVNGPYPWKECLATLDDLFQRYGGCPPLDVHKGGYIGLDATPLERCCGFLMSVNQSDTKVNLRLSPEKQQALDDMCRKYRVKWRKTRGPDGQVVSSGDPTFITNSYNAFKYMYENPQKFPAFKKYLETNFPGYPQKHMRMECTKTLESGSAPPRHNPRAIEEKQSSKIRQVMCRVCREHVAVTDWTSHQRSAKHRENMHRSCSPVDT